MSGLDIPAFVADLKDHVGDHGFHIHDDRHFVETYSLRQAFEVDLHPEHACGGPLDLHLALDVEPRAVLSFEDSLLELGEDVPFPTRKQVAAAWTSAASVRWWRGPPSPSTTASITAVQCRLLTWSSGAPAAMRRRTTSSCPRCAAAISAVPS